MVLTVVLCLSALAQEVLPGSNLSLQQAKAESRVIVVAEVVQKDLIVGLGAVTFVGGIVLQPSTVLKGTAKGEELRGLGYSRSGNEVDPKDGPEYLFFLTEYKGHLSILKVLPNTKENLEAAKGP